MNKLDVIICYISNAEVPGKKACMELINFVVEYLCSVHSLIALWCDNIHV